jgi:hypothetical protein
MRFFEGAEFNAVGEDGVGNLDMKTLYNIYGISWKVNFAGIRTPKGEKKSRSYAYLKEGKAGKGSKLAVWRSRSAPELHNSVVPNYSLNNEWLF